MYEMRTSPPSPLFFLIFFFFFLIFFSFFLSFLPSFFSSSSYSFVVFVACYFTLILTLLSFFSLLCVSITSSCRIWSLRNRIGSGKLPPGWAAPARIGRCRSTRCWSRTPSTAPRPWSPQRSCSSPPDTAGTAAPTFQLQLQEEGGGGEPGGDCVCVFVCV